MKYDEDKIDEMALALLFLTTFRERKDFPWRAWKSMDWDVLDRMVQKGWIHDSKGKTKSVYFTPEGHKLMVELFNRHFAIDVATDEQDS